jgi:hypothetical protein
MPKYTRPGESAAAIAMAATSARFSESGVRLMLSGASGMIVVTVPKEKSRIWKLASMFATSAIAAPGNGMEMIGALRP